MAQPLVVVFMMSGCGACEEYWPRFESLAKPFYDFRGLPIQVYNVNQAQALAKKHGIKFTPTTIVQDRNGTITRHEGAISSAEILGALQSALR